MSYSFNHNREREERLKNLDIIYCPDSMEQDFKIIKEVEKIVKFLVKQNKISLLAQEKFANEIRAMSRIRRFHLNLETERQYLKDFIKRNRPRPIVKARLKIPLRKLHSTQIRINDKLFKNNGNHT